MEEISERFIVYSVCPSLVLSFICSENDVRPEVISLNCSPWSWTRSKHPHSLLLWSMLPSSGVRAGGRILISKEWSLDAKACLQWSSAKLWVLGTQVAALSYYWPLTSKGKEQTGQRLGPRAHSQTLLMKPGIGISDPFRRKRMWLSAALGHVNAHMQSGCLRIKPSIKRGIINRLWVWQTFPLGRRGLDLLGVMGEWMRGVGAKEVNGAPQCPGGFSSQ